MPILPVERTRREPLRHNQVWTVEITGDTVDVHAWENDYVAQRGGRRGKIVGFSRASRKRMLMFVSKINWGKVNDGVFITLTWPDKYIPKSSYEMNYLRHRFLRYMENHLVKKVGAIWRIEWVIRKSGSLEGTVQPHIHLIVFGTTFVHGACVREWWRKCIDASGPLCTDVRSLTSKRMHQVYIAKYAAKMPDDPSLDYVAYLNIRGRHWGYHRRELIPMHESRKVVVNNPNNVAALRRLAAKVLPWYDTRYDSGFSLFGKFGAALVRAVEKIVIDEEEVTA